MGAKLSEIKFTLSCFWLTGVLLKTIILLSILTAKTSPAIAQDLNIDCHEYLNSLQKPPSDYYEVNNKAVKYVRILYLVPADSSVKPEYALSLKNAVVHLQQWYKEQLYGKKTFNLLPDPIIEIYQTQHNAEWYSTNSNGSYWMWFWNNVTDDAFKLTGGRFWDPNNIWVIYIDAFNACGQCGGCGGLGTAVISANDLRGLTGQPWMPICPGEGREYTPCRYAGGLGHELGHAFGLPHPPGCEEGLPGCDRNSIMWFGYITYPNTYFSENEKATLINSPFINKIKLRECYYDCADLLHNYFYKEEIDLDICEGESYFAERQWQTKTGTYYDTLQTIYGCDSIIITHLTVHDTYESTANAEICGGESYFADEEWQAEAGTYYDSLMTVYGCDSVIITNLSVHEKIETFVNTGICDNESYFAGGDWQSETGTYYDSLTTVYGCDSIVITNLSVYETYESVNNADICEGESYFAGGDRQTKPGTYYDNHTSIHGCDSTIITNLSVNNRYVISRDTTICEGNMVYVGGSWRKDPGTYYDSLTTVYSCDSIIITTLNIEVCTNIEVIQEDIGVIYPIPTSGMVYIQYPDFKYVEVFTISGIKLMKTQDNRIDLSGYNEGIYLFRIYNNEDKFFIRKVQLILNQ